MTELVVDPSKGPNRVGIYFSSPETETDLTSEQLCFLVFRILNDV
jgi:hypothetical protein